LSLAILAIASPTFLDISTLFPTFSNFKSEAAHKVLPVVSSIN
jgi:hypothetical protein